MYPYVQSSTIHNSQDMETTQSVSTAERIKKMWYIYTMEYYSAIKKNKTMSLAAIWIQLEIIILHEVRKTKTIPYHFYM